MKRTIPRCAYCRHELQGQGMEHEGYTYCSRSCRELGIDRINRSKKTRPWGWGWLSLVLSLGSLMGMNATDTWAQQHHHEYHKDFYQHWKVPTNPSESCCNARITHPNGAETGDCMPVKAEIRKGDWWAYEPITRQWLKIPDERIVWYENPNIFEAHLCFTPQKGVICFKPPDTGG